MTVITIGDYMIRPPLRELADRVMAAAGLDPDDVFEIVVHDDHADVAVIERRNDGKVLIVNGQSVRSTRRVDGVFA